MTVGYPEIGVYVAWDNKPTDGSFNFQDAPNLLLESGSLFLLEDGTSNIQLESGASGLSDITRYVTNFGYRRGRQSTLNVVQTGTGNVTLKDTLRNFDPQNTASPYYPNVLPEKPIQIRAFINGSTYYLMTHFFDGWPQTRKQFSYAEWQTSTSDGFDLLSLYGLAGKNYGVQYSGALINAILNDASWPTGMRNLATGQSQIDSTGSGGTGFSATDSTKALDFIQQIVGFGGENGLFFIAGDGTATFLDRNSQYTSPYNTSQATFTDVLTEAGEFQYTDIKPASDKTLIFNDWSGTTATGTTQEALNSTSIGDYGQRTQTISSILTSDADTMSAMQYNLAIYKDPLQRVQSITIKPGNYAELWIQCLSREVGDRITVKQHPPGGGQAIIQDYTIQSITAQFSAGPVVSAVFTWGLFPASLSPLILDDAASGVLDTSRLGF